MSARHVFAIAIALVPPSALAAAPTPPETIMRHASGTFDVAIAAQAPDNDGARDGGVGRLALDKRFHGGLDAGGAGEMLYAGDGTQDGAYVAIERVSGRLDGREGSFQLVHHALMDGGAPTRWTVTVVPGSGTGALAGLRGDMRIEIEGKVHRYAFDYALPEAPAP